MKSVYDKDFVYTPSVATDLKAKFDAIREKRQIALKAELERSEAIAKEAEAVVAKTKIKGKAA